MRMTITRLRAYGERWNLWSRINRNTGNKSVFPKDKRDRKVVVLTANAEYTAAGPIIREYTRTKPGAGG